MPGDDARPERFEDVDWSEVSDSTGFSPSGRTTVLLACLSVLAGLFAYDLLLVADRAATFGAVGWEYDVTQLDWLFGVSLALTVSYGVVPLAANPRTTRYYWDSVAGNRPAMLSLGYLAVVFGVGLLGPLFVSNPEASLLAKYQPPVFTAVDSAAVVECTGAVRDGQCHGTWQHPFGTTGSGKDVLAVVVHGTQTSLKVGLTATFVVLVVGSLVGTVAAQAGGLVDEALMRYVDVQQTVPGFVLFLLVVYLFEPSLLLFVAVFGGLSWGDTARYVRSNALRTVESGYVAAAEGYGASTWRIVRRHLLPNAASSIVTELTLLVPTFVLMEAALSFLGLGDPSAPSWGRAIASGRTDLSFAWWVSTIPGVVLFLTVLAFNFLGDALLDALDPRAETERGRAR